MIKKYLILFLLIGIVSGCAATLATGPLFSEAPPSTGNKSTLYVFRTKSSWLAPKLTVKINGKPLVALDSLGYSYAYLSPGIYRLTFDSGFITEIEIKEGQDLFVECHAANGFGEGTRDVPKTQALDEIKNYRYVNPLNTIF